MKIAAVNWKLRPVDEVEDFLRHLDELLDKCLGCDIVVLPELFVLELLAMDEVRDERRIPEILSAYAPIVIGWLSGWSVDRRTTIVGGSLFLESMNACPIVYDGLPQCTQGKNVLTEWERHIGVQPGAGLSYRPNTGVGVTVCLDAEFPASGRALAEAGMLFQCVPAWTETMHGFQRVRWACQARAVENQVCVIHSSLVGRVGNEESHGSSAIIVPPHLPFPLNPILAETPMDEEGVAIAEVDPNDLIKCREMGEVRNWRDRDAGDWTVTAV